MHIDYFLIWKVNLRLRLLDGLARMREIFDMLAHTEDLGRVSWTLTLTVTLTMNLTVNRNPNPN